MIIAENRAMDKRRLAHDPAAGYLLLAAGPPQRGPGFIAAAGCPALR